MKKLILLSCLLLAGCPQPNQQTPEQYTQARWARRLPPDSTEITVLGNGWITFRWHGKKYLYQFDSEGHGRYSSIVELKDE